MNSWYKGTAVIDFAGIGCEKRRYFRAGDSAWLPVSQGRGLVGAMPIDALFRHHRAELRNDHADLRTRKSAMQNSDGRVRDREKRALILVVLATKNYRQLSPTMQPRLLRKVLSTCTALQATAQHFSFLNGR